MRLHGEAGTEPATGTADAGPLRAAAQASASRFDDPWFDAPLCRNCGAALSLLTDAQPHCPQCGQKRAVRFTVRDLRQETWERWRLFEFATLNTLRRLATGPGTVAREYVLGRRKDHAHPLKLLLVLVALMVLMIATNGFFDTHAYSSRQDPALARMAELVQAYANWSFSLSILAIFGASYLVFHGRLGSNAIEHAVLAVYCQCTIMAALLLGLLPTLVWDAPQFIGQYKVVFGNVMYAVKLLLVGLAFHQFFRLNLRRDWWRLLLALLAYAGASWLLLRGFARVVLWLVQRQMA